MKASSDIWNLNLSYEWNQVVWNPERIFSNDPGLVSSNGIEVSQKHSLPILQ
jgi:hypothetical protein